MSKVRLSIKSEVTDLAVVDDAMYIGPLDESENDDVIEFIDGKLSINDNELSAEQLSVLRQFINTLH